MENRTGILAGKGVRRAELMIQKRHPEVFFPSNKLWAILDAMTAIALHSVKGCVVEIGTSRGEFWSSTAILADRAYQAKRKFYSCDIWKQARYWDYDNHVHFQGPSVDFMKQFSDGPAAVVFIDGKHDYEVVIEEVKFFLSRMNVGGLLLLHDTYPKVEKLLDMRGCGDVYRARQEMESWKDQIDCITFPYASAGLTMAIKKEENRPYYRR